MAQFGVAAVSQFQMSYQRKYNQTNSIVGAITSAFLKLLTVTVQPAGLYSVVVANAYLIRCLKEGTERL